MNQKVLNALNAGATITYAPVEGGLILLKGDEKEPSNVDKEIQPTMIEFLELRENKVIKEIDSMGQGHHIFRGPVTIYSINPQE